MSDYENYDYIESKIKELEYDLSEANVELAKLRDENQRLKEQIGIEPDDDEKYGTFFTTEALEREDESVAAFQGRLQKMAVLIAKSRNSMARDGVGTLVQEQHVETAYSRLLLAMDAVADE